MLATFAIQNQQNLVMGAVQSTLGVSVASPVPSNQQCGQQGSGSTSLTIKQLVNTAFKSPAFTAVNSTPGQWYQNGVNNESQTVLNSTSGWTNQVGAVPGQADAATRIRVNFVNIPPGASVSVPASISNGGGNFVATANGDIGVFSAESGTLTIMVSGSVTYEVRSQFFSPANSFTIPITVNPSSSGNSGTILASATYGPTTSESATASPRFADTLGIDSCVQPAELSARYAPHALSRSHRTGPRA